MPKIAKFGKLGRKTKANIKEKKDQFVERLTTDPFSILNVNDIVNIYNDPLGVLEKTVTDPKNAGMIISSALSCVPYVGPLLSSIFTNFWPQDPEKPLVTMEELEQKLEDLRAQMETAMDKKVKDSEVRQWKRICDAFFNGLISNMEVLKDKIAVLKKRLQEGETESSLKTYVREALEVMRVQVKAIISFCASHTTVEDTTDYYMDCLFIYLVIMRHLDSFWFQLDIDEYFVTGYPAESGDEAIKSFRERVDLVLRKGINDISIGASRKIIQPIEDFSIVNGQLVANNADIKEIHPKVTNNGCNLLKFNQLLYPIPLIEHSKKICPFESGREIIRLPDNKRAYIYRVDGAMFCPSDNRDYIRGSRQIPGFVEPMSGCTGVFNSSGASLPFTLSTNRLVQVRVYGIYYYGRSSLLVNGKFIEKENKLQPLKCVDSNIEKEGVVSGLMTSKIFATKKVYLEFLEIFKGEEFREKILFVEIIVHDDSETPVNIPEEDNLIGDDEFYYECNEKEKVAFAYNEDYCNIEVSKALLRNPKN